MNWTDIVNQFMKDFKHIKNLKLNNFIILSDGLIDGVSKSKNEYIIFN